MSEDVRGGTDYALVKRHYDADDAVTLRVAGVTYLNGIPFTATETYYTVGLMAYLNDTTVVNVNRGWTTFAHGQPAAPAYLLPFLTTLGITAWPTSVPAFEAKDLLFFSDQDCWVRFEGSSRVQHYIPANTFKRFHRRCFMFFVVRDTANGSLIVDIEG